MNSSDISTISKKMESMSMTDRVIRHNKRLPQSRYSPYTNMANIISEKHKDEAIQLGVELSLFLAEAMFILSDNVCSTLVFGPLIFKHAGYKNIDDKPVIGRLYYVIFYVFETYIKPKNGVYNKAGESIHWGLYEKSLQNFILAIREFIRIFLVLGKRKSSCGGVMKPSDFEQYRQELKKLEEKFRPFKDVSEANGFAREAIKSNILHMWESLFETPMLKLPIDRMIEMFMPFLNQAREDDCSRLFASLHI